MFFSFLSKWFRRTKNLSSPISISQKEPTPKKIVFTQEQKEAINFPEKGSLLIIAGPGTGKSTTLLERISVQLQKGPAQSRYRVLCFTNKSINNLEKNFLNNYPKLKNHVTKRIVTFSTVNSFARSQLKQTKKLASVGRGDLVEYNIELFLEMPKNIRKYCGNPLFDLVRNWNKLLAEAISRIRGQGLDPTDRELMKKHLCNFISCWKSQFSDELKSYKPINGADFFELFLQLLDWYLIKPIEETGREQDFSDDIELATQFLKKQGNAVRKGEHVFVDEFQDINTPQWEFIKSYNAEYLFLIGDPRQSIFAFQGSNGSIINDPKNFDHPGINLTGTFRFKTKQAHALLNSIIKNSNIPNRKDLKDIRSPKTLTNNNPYYETCFFPTIIKAREFILSEIHKIRDQTKTGRKHWPRIAILFRSRCDELLQEKLIKNGIKISSKDRLLRNKKSSSGLHLRVNKIFLCLILGNWKNLVNSHQNYGNIRKDFEKIFYVLSGDQYRKDKEHLVLSKGKALFQNYIDTAPTTSLIDFVLSTYPEDSDEYRSFLPLKTELSFWQNWEESSDGQVSFSRKELTELFIEEIRKKGELWESTLMERGLWDRRQALVDAYQKLNDTKQLTIWLSEVNMTREANYSPDIVRMMNVHQAKGREWDYVFIHEFEIDKWPPKYSLGIQGECDPEEWRILYVAASRAKIKNYFISRQGKMSQLKLGSEKDRLS